MATQAFHAERDPGPVIAPADLVALVGAEQLRRLHVRLAQKLKTLRRGEKALIELEQGESVVAHVHIGTRERV